MTQAIEEPVATALVTGGLGAIGGALVAKLRARGVRVCVVDYPNDPGGFDGEYEQCDLGDFASIDALAERLRDSWPGFDHVVHAAGIIQDNPLADEPREAWMRVLAVDLIGPIALTQQLLPLLNDGGSIVFISSGTVFKGTPGHSAYVAAKAGLIGFGRTLARELGDRGIRVNSVAPGHTATPLVEHSAAGEPAQIAGRALKRRELAEDVAGAISLLLAPEAGFVTGQTLVVDGGSVMH